MVRDEQAGPLDDLGLPDQTRVIYIYRDGHLEIPTSDAQLKAQDEVVLLTHRDRLNELKQQLAPST